MSQGAEGDRPATAAELADLRASVEELREANQALRDANTERERREARKDVGDAEADLDAVARSLGISREALDRAANEAKTAERKDELRPILKDLYAEIRQEEADAEAKRIADEEAAKKDKPPKGDKAPKGDKPAKDEPAATDAPPGDEGPTVEHWSERGIKALLK